MAGRALSRPKDGSLVRPQAMSSSSSSPSSPLPDDINAELALWRQLAFDMPSHQENRLDSGPASDDSSSSQFPSSHLHLPHAAQPLPPDTYNYLIHALLSLQGLVSHARPQNYPPTYPYPIHSSLPPNHHFPWPPGTASSVLGPSSFHPPTPHPPRAIPQSASSLPLTPPPLVSPATAPTAQDPEGAEDAVSIAEDKRRRNTAASARFRLKKKLKTLDLERMVAELTGRTEELEREATDLRRENAWLKEIVLLRGRNLAMNTGSQVAASGSRYDEDDRDNRAHTESEPESTVKHRERGKDKQNGRNG